MATTEAHQVGGASAYARKNATPASALRSRLGSGLPHVSERSLRQRGNPAAGRRITASAGRDACVAFSTWRSGLSASRRPPGAPPSLPAPIESLFVCRTNDYLNPRAGSEPSSTLAPRHSGTLAPGTPAPRHPHVTQRRVHCDDGGTPGRRRLGLRPEK